MTNGVGWLHLTDLHWGSVLGTPLFKTVQTEILEDLAYLHDASGPWDLVFFTGDLVQTGTTPEYEDLESAVLGRLRDHLGRLGSANAVVIPVPGNHDLTRPSKIQSGLRHYPDDAHVAAELLKSGGEFDQTIRDAFVPYSKWLNQLPVVKEPTWKPGFFPGEFSLRLDIGGLRVGVVGLNTAAIHLDDSFVEGTLATRLSQFMKVCPDPVTWDQSSDVRVILTHHPVKWLAPNDQTAFLEDIAPPSRFHLHLHGHMHEPDSLIVSRLGSAPRHTIQGASLCGLESYSPAKTKRIFGYSAGRFSKGNKGIATDVWPRRMRRIDGAGYAMRDDFGYELNRRTYSYSHPSRSEPDLTAIAGASHSRAGLHEATWFSELDWRALFAQARAVWTIGVSSSSLYAGTHLAIVKDFLRRPESRLTVTVADPENAELMGNYEALFKDAPGDRARSVRRSIQRLATISSEVGAASRVSIRCFPHMTRYASFIFDDSQVILVPYRNRPAVDPAATLALRFGKGEVLDRLILTEKAYVDANSRAYTPKV